MLPLRCAREIETDRIAEQSIEDRVCRCWITLSEIGVPALGRQLAGDDGRSLLLSPIEKIVQQLAFLGIQPTFKREIVEYQKLELV